MKVFLRSCSLYEVKKALDYSLIDGVYLVSENGDEMCVAADSDMESIIKIMPGPVFIFVKGETADELLENSLKLVRLGPNVSLKLKASLESLKACRLLSDKGISVNLFGVCNLGQAGMAVRAGAEFVSFAADKFIENRKHDQAQRLEVYFQGDMLKGGSLFVADRINSVEGINEIFCSDFGAIAISFEQLMGIMDLT